MMGEIVQYPKEQYCEEAYECRNQAHTKDKYGRCSLPQDCGRMQENVDELAKHVVGRKIVKAEQVPERAYPYAGLSSNTDNMLVLTLDNGLEVLLKKWRRLLCLYKSGKFFASPRVSRSCHYGRWYD